MQKPYK